ncbi:MAG: hypothetical protein JWR20_1570 [Marmoricola sp.]|nr:hypothetical protein [Marmoricola sp.]
MSETQVQSRTQGPGDHEFDRLAREVADAAEVFLLGLQEISQGETASTAVPLLLLEVSQLLLAGARLGVQIDFEPREEFQPDGGPDPDLDAMRLRLADVLGEIDTYAHNLEPYDPETVPTQLSDDLTLIASDVAHGLRHYRRGDVAEALWWWQFSYLASWGTNACGVLSALHSVVAHSRLDADIEGEDDLVAAADALDS